MKLEIDKEFLKRFKDSTVLLYSALAISFAAGLLFSGILITLAPYIFDSIDISIKSDKELFIGILMHNAAVTILLLLVTIFICEKKFQLLLKVYPIYNGSLIGIAISYVAIKTNILYSIMMVLPHGVIEFAGICLIVNSGHFFREKEDSFRKLIQKFAMISIVIIFIDIVAAYVEVYITRDIASLFL